MSWLALADNSEQDAEEQGFRDGLAGNAYNPPVLPFLDDDSRAYNKGYYRGERSRETA